MSGRTGLFKTVSMGIRTVIAIQNIQDWASLISSDIKHLAILNRQDWFSHNVFSRIRNLAILIIQDWAIHNRLGYMGYR